MSTRKKRELKTDRKLRGVVNERLKSNKNEMRVKGEKKSVPKRGVQKEEWTAAPTTGRAPGRGTGTLIISGN